MNDFEGIEPPLGVALAKRGYTDLTPVQKAVLGPELSGADALVSAQTGSGKTVAFGLAIAPTLLDGAPRLGRSNAPLALVIAPTRELALQVARELTWLYQEAGASIATCVGGMDMRDERRALDRGAHIVVGTPGRLKDHIMRNSLNLTEIRAVVLDEADEMLDLGFREDLEFILDASPKERRTLMFSATVPKSIATLAQNYQRNAVRLATQSEQKQHIDIEYRALPVAASDRDNAIVNVLRFYEAPNAIIFCNTRAAVNHLTSRLHNRGFTVVALSGELSQNERTHALQAMRDGRARVCIATDVAARGIDLPNLELVIHADLPTNPDTLLHRSGRTGRAGRKGVSALIVPGNARRKAERLLQMAQLKVQWAAPPSADEVNSRDEERLLNDELFSETVKEEERDFVDNLIAKHGAEQVAAAFVRLYRSGRSAPEELIDIGPVQDARPARAGREFPIDDSPRPRREDFGPSTWLSLSVGRKQNAEPRWLIPLLCRAGNMTKRDIGAIKMHQDETYVQLSQDALEGFLHNVGPNKTLERGIRISVIDGQPDVSKPSGAPKKSFAERKHGGERKFEGERKPYEDRTPSAERPAREKPAYAKKSNSVAEEFGATNTKKKFGRKPDFAGAERPFQERPFADRPPSDRPGKDWAKPSKPAFAGPADGLKKKKKPKSNAN
ncbi:DEAD/DEAH box helicase [Rhizobium sp. TH2]|uniref:DEAD/DEAH box helicase n=1 Tax=Rhizobium sp. TH2 TaxID=2775403 RepID=UPI002157C7DA|nr:DEAD/DEAH box helicase [Rhizobium sp. TH2]UVC07880.1 DEAD/DEAH box helicase [Rhizobium sp. TH2]